MGLANATASLRTASVRQDQRQYCVLLESHPANGLRPSFAQAGCKECAALRQAARSALRSAGRKGSMFSIYLHFCLHYRSKSLKNILKLSPIIPFKSVSYKPVKGKQQLEDKRITLGGVASD